jgi:hypothetical protein
MPITSSLPLGWHSRIVGRPLLSPAGSSAIQAPPQPGEGAPWDRYQPAESLGNQLRELWRDFGIHPKAMLRRATVDKALPMGAPLPQGVKAPESLLRALQERLHLAIDSSDDLSSLQNNLTKVAAALGVGLQVQSGVPTVNWDSTRPAVLDVRHSGGPAALHEMVHVVQCLIGAGAALGQAAAEKHLAEMGQEADSPEQLQPYLRRLSDGEKAQAMERLVKPMESMAYGRFEQAAFHAAGMSGRKSQDFPAYQQRLKEVVNAFAEAYGEAAVPRLQTAADARLYGGIAHLARTHGETGLLLVGAGAAYYGLARTAMRLHPALGIPLAAPLGYVLYRALVSG